MFKLSWTIQLSLNYVFIAKFGSKKNLKSVNALANLQAKRLTALQ